jgi:molybdenum cofactor synthesis domain-containing protein
VAETRTAFVLTVSDRGASGDREDVTGAGVAERLAALGFTVERGVVPDERGRIEAALTAAAARHALVITAGGTGLTPRDVTITKSRASPRRCAPTGGPRRPRPSSRGQSLGYVAGR